MEPDQSQAVTAPNKKTISAEEIVRKYGNLESGPGVAGEEMWTIEETSKVPERPGLYEPCKEDPLLKEFFKVTFGWFAIAIILPVMASFMGFCILGPPIILGVVALVYLPPEIHVVSTVIIAAYLWWRFVVSPILIWLENRGWSW